MLKRLKSCENFVFTNSTDSNYLNDIATYVGRSKLVGASCKKAHTIGSIGSVSVNNKK